MFTLQLLHNLCGIFTISLLCENKQETIFPFPLYDIILLAFPQTAPN